ncbi:MAG: 5'/3'-nucleotidase SurE [Planctomycetota bacterium]
MRILLTNDDGIDAPGLAALYRAIESLGEVHVIAPALVQSATSHAVTFHRPISVEQCGLGHAVSGRPADCVKLGIHALVKEPIDLVISGMNSGANVGINVLYSGTVGAAREANFNGIPAIAVSLHIGDWGHDHWDRAAQHARRTIDQILAGPLDGDTLLNVNVPVLDDGAEPVGVKVAPASMSKMIVDYKPGTDDAGNPTYQVCNTMTFAEREPDTDVSALYEKYITVTPLHFDTTCPTNTPAWAELLGS